ncbi:MAG: ketoacyl-ACP synthase III [Verrucomicrobia bacterium]|nr:ketoacyl-ACP synthase III [Verrucomicrobiota bacterium]
MTMRSTVILGTGSHAPERVVTNNDLALQVETSDEWIRTRTGIRERRLASPATETSDLAVAAALPALAQAGLTPADIDLLIVATITPDTPVPACACHVQRKLGVPTHAACFDLNAACSGFIYALDTAAALLTSGRYRHALVIGAEKLSGIVDWQDRTTCVLFGDGAGAVVLGTSDEPGRGLLGTRLGGDGANVELLCVPPPVPGERGPFLRMRGKEIFKLAVRAMDDAAREILEQQGVRPDQVSLVIPHQANQRIIDAIAEYLELPPDRFFVNLDRYGNTSAASIPLALDEAHRAGRIRRGDLVLLVAFGAGLTYGSALLRW